MSHNHQESDFFPSQDKFTEAFSKFTFDLSMEEVSAKVQECIDKHYKELDTKENVNLIHSMIDLTSLTSEDNEDKIYHLTQQVNQLDDEHPDITPVASICVYPNYASVIKEHLTVEKCHITCVAGGFPSSQTFPEIKVAEIALAVHDGAEEIDIVLPVGPFLAGDYETVCDQLQEQRQAAKDVILKVILETGALQTPEHIVRASILSLFCDADFIKTSTGKGYPGATPEAIYIMASVVRQYCDLYDIKRGIKAAGGVRTTEEALKYLCILKEVLGDEWLTPELFRFGATSLEADTLKHLL
nr:deoxyribose-phosphate aldolase [uncultured Porphyromonas sp.]